MAWEDVHDNVLSEGNVGYKTEKLVGVIRCMCKQPQRDLEKETRLDLDCMNSNPALLTSCHVSSGK